MKRSILFLSCMVGLCAFVTGCNKGEPAATDAGGGGKLTTDQENREKQRAADMAKQYQGQQRR